MKGIEFIMSDLKRISFEVRVTPGRAGTDPNAPDWEVCELEDGAINTDADIYDNLTEAEAHKLASMWSQKKDEAVAKKEAESES